MNLLTASGTAKIITKSTKYLIVSNPCGSLLFKILLHKATMETRGTASNMRENMWSIDTCISTVNFDIDKLNEYSKIKYEALTARGERCNEMMSNMFKGYIAARIFF